ncbi:MAG: HAMP domain-containing histidine kinase [Ruminococcaceae bacterium]|nr:HAMP domain-containing histidine kinase [Oscillospiraceae bacterium]
MFKGITKGITKRWVMNTFGVIIAIITLLIICLSVSIKSLCYSSIEQALLNRNSELSAVFPGYKCENTAIFQSTASKYVEDFQHKESMELMILNANGRVTVASTGFESDEDLSMPDYKEALNNETGFAQWTGKLSSGEKVMATTHIVRNSKGTSVGAVRFVVSLRKANMHTFVITLIASFVGLIIIACVAFSGNYFIRSIVKPVREMSETAKRIAQGDFDAKLTKMYDDEIGELCDSINDMAKELDASEKLKNDFISRVSHELRTPLTAIKGWAETMQYGVPDRITLEKGMSVIVKESSRLTGIVEELLDFSKLQSGRLTMQMQKIDILAEVDEAVYMLKERALSEGKHLLYDEPEIMPPVYGDRNRLKQVFINVLDNAIKYTPEGGMIGVQVYQDYKEDMIKVVVADNGCGISADDIPKIKDKFYKANQKVNGSGIGLAVADEIIKLHNGHLDIDSSPDVGTTVTIGIPTYKHQDEVEPVTAENTDI